MVRSSQKRAHRRALDRHAQETVDLYNYEADDSERVQEWAETTDSPHTDISARIVPRNTPRANRGVRESGDVEGMFDVYIDDTEGGVSSIRDGGGKGASKIDVDQNGIGSGGTDLRVMLDNDPGSGLRHLVCERID